MTSIVPRVGITAAAASLPAREVTTGDLQARVAAASGLPLPDGMFAQATGIATRRIAADDEYASDLAVAAARQVLDETGLDPLDVDLLLFASATRDMVEPATAHVVQAALGSRAHALDVTNACNSFLNGIDLARSMILAGRARRALVVTGETPTRAMRPRLDGMAQVRKAFAGYTFGDAGAAVLVEPVATGGIVDVDAETHSEHWPVGGIFGGGSRHPRGDEHTYFTGDGHRLRGVFEKIGIGLIERVNHRCGLAIGDYAWRKFKQGAELGGRSRGERHVANANQLARGIDPSKDLIPVIPAAHYMMGGIVTDLTGRSSLARLYACGEVSRTGVHGANRLASNSLLEGLVFAERVARDMIGLPKAKGIPRKKTWEAPVLEDRGAAQVAADDVRTVMWDHAGIDRTAKGLRKGLALLADIEKRLPPGATEETNLVTTARLIVESALLRKESRGGHFRSDFPHAVRKWRGRHIEL